MTSKQTSKPWILSKIPAEDSCLWEPVSLSCWFLFHSLQDSVYRKSWVFPPVTAHSNENELCCLNVCTSPFLSAKMTTEPVSLHGSMQGLALGSIYSLLLHWDILHLPFEFCSSLSIPKPFMSIVLMNLCNPLSVFVYCCPSGFSIPFYLSFEHPVCVSLATIDLNLQLLRSSHCLCSSSHPGLGFSLCPMLCCLLHVLIHVLGETKPLAGLDNCIVHLSLVLLWLCMTWRDYTGERDPWTVHKQFLLV